MDEANIENVKEFLKLDKEVKFSFVDSKKLRTSIKNFDSVEKFVEYMLQIFENSFETRKKIKLKK
jgi:hypothetical protein